MSPRVLYVDDDPPNLVVFAAALGEEFDVLTAADAREALVLLASNDVALLIADQRMPGMSGVELCEVVCRDYPSVVRFLITAYADLDAVIDAINHGHVHRYLRKPWDAAEMRVHLREGLELHALGRRLRELERRMREVERVYALGVVAASIVHELRNPMSVVASYVDLGRVQAEKLAALAGPAGAGIAEELDRTLSGAWDAVMRMAEITRGVELSSRMQAGVARADLGEVVELTIKIVINDLRHRAMTTFAIASGLPVGVNPTQLGQVTLNLLVNALQAVPPSRSTADARIDVVVAPHAGRARLTVADNGNGVPDELKEKIFDPFFTTKAEGGTGLGLAISKKIVEDAGGTLRIVDTAGGGATFIVDLPVVVG